MFFGVKIILFLFVWQRAKREEQRAKRKTTCSIITAYCLLFVQCSLFVVCCCKAQRAESREQRAKRENHMFTTCCYCWLPNDHCLLLPHALRLTPHTSRL